MMQSSAQVGRNLRCVLTAAVLTMAIQGGLAYPSAGQEEAGPDREGFTLLLNLGVGFQHDKFVGKTETGLAGLNLGIGGFLTSDVALMFRASGTNVGYGGVRQTSGFGGPAVQYWPNDRLSLEGGAGLGFWRVSGDRQGGFGAFLGVGYALLNRGKHNLHLGVEYAPAFTDPEMIHNVGIVVGWQLL